MKKFHSCLDRIKNKELKTCFQKKKVLLSTRQPPNLCKRLTTAKFERLATKTNKTSWIFPSRELHLWILFKSKSKLLNWHYKCFFSFDSKDVLCVIICSICDFFYIGQAEESKQRTQKHKLDVIHPNKKCSELLRTCSKMKEPYFNIYIYV